MRQLRDLRVPMRDGVTLSLHAWLPADAATVPVVLLRTPYRCDATEFERLGLRAYVEHGYGVAMQSVRGRGASEGMFGFFFHPGPVRCFSDARKAHAERFRVFFHAMLDRGVYLAPSAYEAGFVSLAHRPRDVAETLAAARKAFAKAARAD